MTINPNTSTEFRINPDRLRAIVTDGVRRQPPEIAEELRRALTWHGAEVASVTDNPDRLVSLAAGIPIAFVNRTELEDDVQGAADGLSTPDGYRK